MSNPSSPIILAGNGRPFTSEKLAKEAIKDQELDPKIFKAMREQGGWCIFNTAVCPSGLIASLKKPATGEIEPTKSKQPKTKYFKVVFQQKTNENEDEEVSFSLNGTKIILKRGVGVILSEHHLEVIDHAERDQYEQKPGHTRKIVGKVSKYMYSKKEEVTEADYIKFMRKGNEIRDKDIEKMQKTD